MQRYFAGFTIGAALGLAVGLVTGRIALIGWLLNPTFDTVKQIAIFAWIPLISLWLGNTETAKAVFIAIAAFFPVFLNAQEGARSIELKYLDVADIFRLTRRQKLRRLILPAALPSIITGLRLGSIYAWLATIGAEYFFTNSAGVGNAMNDDRELFHMDNVILGMIVIGIVGVALNSGARVLEVRLTRWRGD